MKAAAEKERLKEKKAIWDIIHTKSGQQIVQAVKAGTQIGSVSFTDWVKDIADHLKFGPRPTPQLREDMTWLIAWRPAALAVAVATPPWPS